MTACEKDLDPSRVLAADIDIPGTGNVRVVNGYLIAGLGTDGKAADPAALMRKLAADGLMECKLEANRLKLRQRAQLRRVKGGEILLT